MSFTTTFGFNFFYHKPNQNKSCGKWQSIRIVLLVRKLIILLPRLSCSYIFGFYFRLLITIISSLWGYVCIFWSSTVTYIMLWTIIRVNIIDRLSLKWQYQWKSMKFLFERWIDLTIYVLTIKNVVNSKLRQQNTPQKNERSKC